MSCSITLQSWASARISSALAWIPALSCRVRLANPAVVSRTEELGRALRLNAAEPSVDRIRSCTNRLRSARSRSRVSCSASDNDGSLALKSMVELSKAKSHRQLLGRVSLDTYWVQSRALVESSFVEFFPFFFNLTLIERQRLNLPLTHFIKESTFVFVNGNGEKYHIGKIRIITIDTRQSHEGIENGRQ